jgi:hypothetical protein
VTPKWLTPLRHPLNNASVIPPRARAAALLVIAPYLTFASALASPHVHEPEPGHDHTHAVAHSHFAPHHLEAHEHTVEIEFDHDDDHVVWVDSSALHESPYQMLPALTAVPLSFEPVDAERAWSVTPNDDAAPAHGPPRPASPFRGPPPTAV